MTTRQPARIDVVLKCGCVRDDYGAIIVLGEHHEIQSCEIHDGWFRIIRKANERDRFIFYVLRKPAPTRATKKTLGELLRMSNLTTESEDPNRVWYGQSTLF